MFKLAFLLASIITIMFCANNYEESQLKKDFNRLQELLQKIQSLSDIVSSEAGKNLTKAELQEINKELEVYEQQIEDITKGHKSEQKAEGELKQEDLKLPTEDQQSKEEL